MQKLVDYILKHANRGDCVCGRCADPKLAKQPEGHTADVIFFKVSAKPEANADELRELIKANKTGQYEDLDLFDGEEHNYIDVGRWIGDQGLAITLIGLGAVLGLWTIITPRTLIPDADENFVQQMAQSGMLSLFPLTPVPA